MTYEKLDTYIAAYNRGATLDELAQRLGDDGKMASRIARVTVFNSCLVRLGAMKKRSRRNLLQARKAELAEFRAWKASRSNGDFSRLIAAE